MTYAILLFSAALAPRNLPERQTERAKECTSDTDFVADVVRGLQELQIPEAQKMIAAADNVMDNKKRFKAHLASIEKEKAEIQNTQARMKTENDMEELRERIRLLEQQLRNSQDQDQIATQEKQIKCA